MGLIQRVRRIFESRNLAVANVWQLTTGQAVYSKFSVQKAVKDGYKINPTVYRAVYLITKSAASVPWAVYNQELEPLPEHHLSKLFNHPNPHISRQDIFELLVSWLELVGNAYMKKVKAGMTTQELWPISPDRLGVKPSKNVDEWLAGYILDKAKGITFQPDEIIHLKFFNPANPLLGLSPLEAVSRTVDVDIDQQDWNKSAMKNRGVLDGLVSLDRTFNSQEEADAATEKLNEVIAGPKNARRLRAIGSNAKYLRTAATPVEMDFSNSRKENRNEIYITFGVPPQYAGAQESSTYNNYQISELVFWAGTIIPLLDDIKDTFNFSFAEELKEGETIGYDTSNIQAIQRALQERTKVSKILFNMGVPFSQINKIFQFGVEEFEGWENSYVSTGGEGSIPKPAEDVIPEDERSGDTTPEEIKKKVFTLRKDQ